MCFLIDAARQYIMVVTPWVNDRGVFFDGFLQKLATFMDAQWRKKLGTSHFLYGGCIALW